MIDLLWRPELSAIGNAVAWAFSVLSTIAIFWWMGRCAEREKRCNIERDTGIPYEDWMAWVDGPAMPYEEWFATRRKK
ncbi:hypothetical protein LCGC14_1222470 [marine sediment metagenome]|uniref:Uncharacterized protein n=1 Tax=marine sediment metagenome TaxID=412755 RepID=A0A0F9LAY5_9ZZZZ